MKYPKLKKDRLDKKWYLHLTKNAFIHFHNDWSNLFNKYNWYSWNFLHIYLEKEMMVGGIEFEIIVLGLGFRFRWNDPVLMKQFYNKHEIGKLENKFGLKPRKNKNGKNKKTIR